MRRRRDRRRVIVIGVEYEPSPNRLIPKASSTRAPIAHRRPFARAHVDRAFDRIDIAIEKFSFLCRVRSARFSLRRVTSHDDASRANAIANASARVDVIVIVNASHGFVDDGASSANAEEPNEEGNEKYRSRSRFTRADDERVG